MQMYLHLILLTNTKIDQITYTQCAYQTFASSYIGKKADDLPKEPDAIKSYTVPVSNIDDVKRNPNIIVLKNELGEIGNVVDLALFVFTKCRN